MILQVLAHPAKRYTAVDPVPTQLLRITDA
jgi:hypothetical protein